MPESTTPCRGTQGERTTMTKLHTFDVNAALLAHLRWSMTLEDMIGGAHIDKQMEGHESCSLGVWLYGEGVRRYGDNKTLWVLKVEHKQFHRLADEILERVMAESTAGIAVHMEKLRQVSREVLFRLASLELDASEASSGGGLHRLVSKVAKSLFGAAEPENRRILSVRGARLAHLRWYREVQDALSGRKGNIDAQSSETCALGQWLRQRASDELGQAPELEALDAVHRRFHASIEQVSEALRQGDYRRADDTYSDVYDCSAEIILQLTKLELALEGSAALSREPTINI